MEFTELFITGNGVLDWAGGFISDVDGIVKAALAVVGVVVAVMIIIKNPSVGRTIIGLVVGAFIWGLPYLIPLIGDMFRSDVSATPAVVQEVVIHDTAPTSTLNISK